MSGPATDLVDLPSSGQPFSPIIVHHLERSRSLRIIWLLEELGIPYEVKKYERTPQLRAPDEFFAVNPLGKAPVIEDGNVTLAESGAIVEYLIDRYSQGKLQPPETGKVDNLYYTHYAEGSLAPTLVMGFIFSLVPQNAPFLLRPLLRMIFGKLNSLLIEPELKNHGTLVEGQLTKTGGLFAGGDHPTSADFMMIFQLEMLALRAPAHVGPKTKEYLERVHARPAYKQAIEKGGNLANAKL